MRKLHCKKFSLIKRTNSLAAVLPDDFCNYRFSTFQLCYFTVFFVFWIQIFSVKRRISSNAFRRKCISLSLFYILLPYFSVCFGATSCNTLFVSFDVIQGLEDVKHISAIATNTRSSCLRNITYYLCATFIPQDNPI